ncbi:unnamed protein product [Soboliphyme baturini]|uniref:XRN_N domain-containing protein n=1 Tax=Soboliphyme baturini TaxID=241478 RepID=A0A183J4Q8_9BILA|nr:unnamed protein product [Soboliphyme baturini]
MDVCQIAYKGKAGTSHVTAYPTDHRTQELDKGDYIMRLLFLDLGSALMLVSHDLPLDKLETMDFNPEVIRWVANCFPCSHQISMMMSAPLGNNVGVVQGFPLF